MSRSNLDSVPVIDVDAHIVEPPDLFAARVPRRFLDDADLPRVVLDPATQEDTWNIAGKMDLSIGLVATAGWPEFFPDRPRRFEEIADAAAWDASERLVRMDEYGIFAQILYANIGGFASWMRIRDSKLRLACVQAYNDFAIEWAQADSHRLVPMMGIPFWDIPASVAEMERCYELGYRGMFFGSRPDNVGQPRLTDRHWDPIWSMAQRLHWSVNFHIGFNNSAFVSDDDPQNGVAANTAKMTALTFLTNAHAIADLIISGTCHRFPGVNFVSVESGAGYVPFLLDALDWQWKQCGVINEHPEYDLLPSEYFRRQIFCSFWFETDPANRLFESLGPDNVMYETDFPHPTSMTPGPGSVAQVPRDFIAEHYSAMPEDVFRKVFHDNAARIYSLAQA